MGCENEETLIRYHFGDLSPAEAEAFESRLRDEPELVERLERVRRCLPKDEGPQQPPATEVECPKRLADRTTSNVLSWPQERVEECLGRKRFCLVQLATVGAVATLLGAVVVPAIQHARSQSRLLACENNLRTVYTGLDSYAREHDRHFPEIGPGENAGMFTVSLADGGFLDREREQVALLCPGSELAGQVAHHRAAVVVPTREALATADALLLDRLRRFMAGSYAYGFGHMRGDAYVYPVNRADCRVPLMADAPPRDAAGAVGSRNHGVTGQNVLFQDGHVEFVSGVWAAGDDHLFVNNHGEVAAGLGPRDAVLAPSEATPGVRLRVLRIRVQRLP